MWLVGLYALGRGVGFEAWTRTGPPYYAVRCLLLKSTQFPLSRNREVFRPKNRPLNRTPAQAGVNDHPLHTKVLIAVSQDLIGTLVS